jgi:hypothetical protein
VLDSKRLTALALAALVLFCVGFCGIAEATEQVDIVLDGLSEANEANPGAFIVLNDDGDSPDNDLVNMTLVRTTGSTQGKIRLRISDSDRNNIKVYKGYDKTNEVTFTEVVENQVTYRQHEFDPTELNITQDYENHFGTGVPGTALHLYVEGITASSDLRKIFLELAWTGLPGVQNPPEDNNGAKATVAKVNVVHPVNDDFRFLVSTPAGDDQVSGYTITTGANGVCNTTKAGDDTQDIAVNNGKANQVCITAGTNLVSTPAGDDQTVGNTITTGANGISNTTKTGNDTQDIAVNQGKANEVCITAGNNGTLDTTPGGDDQIVGNTITTGADGVCNTTKAGDDVQVIAVGNGKPNEVCITAGTNLVSTPAGDDQTVGNTITTGANGVCNTTKTGNDTQDIPVNQGKPNQVCITGGANGKEGRVMISTKHDDAYYTAVKTTKADTAAQIADAKLKITAYVTPKKADIKVYFRVVDPDPDDPSPYESDSTTGDNRDTTAPPANKAGALSANDNVTELKTINGTEQAAAEVELTITDRHSGDNYRVEASIRSNYSIKAETALFTAWKRMYVETDKMFRYGRDCADGGGGNGATGTKVYVDDLGTFAANDWVQVFDNQDDAHNTGEIKQIASVDGTKTPKEITLTVALTNTYKVANKAAVGKVIKTGGGAVDEVATFYQGLDTSLVDDLFDTAYVEFTFVTDGCSVVPYKEIICTGATVAEREENCRDFSQPWFKNKQQREDDKYTYPPGRENKNTGKENYIHLISVERVRSTELDVVGISHYSANATFIAIAEIECTSST